MKALNVAIHDTPVGLVACLPPGWEISPYWTVLSPDNKLELETGNVLGVVTKCERCDRTGVDPNCWQHAIHFVKVLAMWPIYDKERLRDEGLDVDWQPHVTVDDSRNVQVCRRNEPADEWSFVDVDLPAAEPGGVALHVEWTDCPTCGSSGYVDDNADDPDGIPCPTCQFLPTVTGDGPFVDVTT